MAFSIHIGLDAGYNSTHPHARCTVDNYIVGVYYNSESSVSTYAGYKFDTAFDTQLEVGAVTGYSGGNVVPFVRLMKGNWFITPAYENKPKVNLGVAIGYEFKL